MCNTESLCYAPENNTWSINHISIFKKCFACPERHFLHSCKGLMWTRGLDCRQLFRFWWWLEDAAGASRITVFSFFFNPVQPRLRPQTPPAVPLPPPSYTVFERFSAAQGPRSRMQAAGGAGRSTARGISPEPGIAPCPGRQALSHCTAREVPLACISSLDFFHSYLLFPSIYPLLSHLYLPFSLTPRRQTGAISVLQASSWALVHSESLESLKSCCCSGC